MRILLDLVETRPRGDLVGTEKMPEFVAVVKGRRTFQFSAGPRDCGGCEGLIGMIGGAAVSMEKATPIQPTPIQPTPIQPTPIQPTLAAF